MSNKSDSRKSKVSRFFLSIDFDNPKLHFYTSLIALTISILALLSKVL